MPYLQIYKNRPNAIYTHSVLKGDDLYEVNLASGVKMTWRYIGKIDPKIYQVSGTLIHKPSIKTISILQRELQPPVKELPIKELPAKEPTAQEQMKDPQQKLQFESFRGWVNEK